MARKGNNSKIGPSLASADWQNTADADVPSSSKWGAADGENSNSSHIEGRSKRPDGSSNKKARSSKKDSRSSSASSMGKPDDQASYKQQQMDTSCDISSSEPSELPSRPIKNRSSTKKSSRRGFDERFFIEQTPLPRLAENILEKTRCMACMAASFFRASMIYLMDKGKRFIDTKRPTINAIMDTVKKGNACAFGKIEHVYPIARAWMLNAGKLMLFLLAVWLDCNIRGFDSLLRLGTNSLLAVLWCCMLSIFAMVGIKKMLILMVIAASAAFFVGLGFAILLTSVLAVVILWFYGSFWATSSVIILGGACFFLKRERLALLVTFLYSMYCARSYVGWLGLLLSLNLSFFSSDVLVHFLKNKVDNRKSNGSSRDSEQSSGRSGNIFEEFQQSADSTLRSGFARTSDRDPGDPSTSGAEKELTSEDEVARLLNCTDHYSVFGFHRYENIDVSSLKREYKKKAMLVHPDKNMGNDKAADAFKKLQSAFEVLLDSLKRKTYDDELRREELLNYFRRFQSVSQSGRNGSFQRGFSPSEGADEGPYSLSRRIACKKCGHFHLWIYTGRAKSQARWCQDCKEFHQAKDGDGWVEQSFQPLLFGILHKPDLPRAYVCAESYIFDVTEWFNCQGMRCPANTHKPTFHVNASVAKQGTGKGSNSAPRGGGIPNGATMDGGINEEEFFEWLQHAVQSGMFETTFHAPSEPPSPGSGSSAKGSSKKKKKGKKQW